ncbi:MAG TPA: hypothetical protein VJQ45_07695, partial [Ktedonobacterales bacterium]|nr:hypothetical protein [Ktedonobacterales bacterium]
RRGSFAVPPRANMLSNGRSQTEPPPELPREGSEDDLDRADGFSITPIEPYVMPAQGAPQRPLDGLHAPDERPERSPRERQIHPVSAAGVPRTRAPGYHGDEFVAGDESDPQEPPQSESHGPHRRWEIFGRRS